MPEELIISDASPLIALIDIEQVASARNSHRCRAKRIHANLPDGIEVSDGYDLQRYQLLRLELDAGKASATALALEQSNSRVILDERKGRLVAKRLNLQVTGTLGIIVKAKENGLITSGNM